MKTEFKLITSGSLNGETNHYEIINPKYSDGEFIKMKELIGSDLIESHSLPILPHCIRMYMDENGRLNNSLLNPIASRLMHQEIFGNTILVNQEEFTGEKMMADILGMIM